MLRPRVIPVLLLRGSGLVKSTRFSKYRYIGDPINAVRLFNDFRADELVFLDILATRQKRAVAVEFVKKVGEEANMPFAVGGGIRSLEEIERLVRAGAERIVIGTAAAEDAAFVKQASDAFGSSTIIVCVDVKKGFFGRYPVYVRNGHRATNQCAFDFVRRMEDAGAGELIIQSIDRDGGMRGYDIPLIRRVSQSLAIPLVCLGGAGSLGHMREAYSSGHASGLAAGSMFVYHGSRRAVLVNYPGSQELQELVV
ncbi:MAG: imidazole glycerol phosphate synthase subunit HisF [Chitinivibrionales bacterium]|nr:imidazole glycerol phosphate synthase subunit HisF [Chitinivibrionales bacterium]